MPTSVLMIYATRSRHLQRVYIPDDDSEDLSKIILLPGESAAIVPMSIYQTGGPAACQKLLGPHDESVAGVCAVVHKDTMAVVDRIIADVEVYHGGSRKTPDGHHLVRSDAAKHGDSWDGEQFFRMYAEIHPETGEIAAIERKPIDDPRPTLDGHHLLVANMDHAVGHKVFDRQKLDLLKKTNSR